MLIEELVVGYEYRVEAPNTKSTEIWTITKIKDNGEIEATGNKTPHMRTLLPESFTKVCPKFQANLDREEKKKARAAKQQERKTMAAAREIESTPVRLVGHVRGVEMWVEHITYMPYHERRGRKTNG